ncbi:MAG: hypothetical protein K2Y01_06775 [Rhabdochlamydiaceae bacterium]|nr:hypothetical protein [Rhabdochlamydiaceae bacterium]
MTDQLYPWKGGEIKGYFYWVSNFIGSSPATQYFAGYVSSPQTSYLEPSNVVQAEGTFNYYGNNFPPGLNAIFLFSGYSNAELALSNTVNAATNTNMYTNAVQYFKDNGLDPGAGEALLGLCLGGGNENGSWNNGEDGAIYSIYKAVTKTNVEFSYTETGTGQTLTGLGTGKLNDDYNCLVFDIENSASNGSTGEDFLKLFDYIKNNSNSTYNVSEEQQDVMIIATMAHSCSNYNGNAQEADNSGRSVCSTIYEASGWDVCPYDYVSPQMYTQNCGTTNEYAANYNILWQNPPSWDSGTPYLFAHLIKSNPNYIKYGMNFLLPAINLANLYQTGGTNDKNPPNLYFYQSTGNNTTPVVESASGSVTLPYTVDSGVVGFFNSIFEENGSSLGGYAQWVNGTLDDITYQVLPTAIENVRHCHRHEKLSKKCKKRFS